MRPPTPVQTAALQQNNEVHSNTHRPRQQQQQPQYKLPLQLRQQQLQLQEQPQITSPTLLNQQSNDRIAAATAQQPSCKQQFRQHDFTVDKPLNFVVVTRATSTLEPDIAVPKLNTRNGAILYQKSARQPIEVKTRQQKQQQQQQQQQYLQQQEQPQTQRASVDYLQLLDLSTSPPHEPVYPVQSSIAYLPQRTVVDVPSPYRRASAVCTTSAPTHRTSFASQYSRSSSSEDGSIDGGGRGNGSDSLRNSDARTSSAFDDAAEHFIINFPAADSPSHNQNECTLNLPLSETEPLLTNIEATIADRQRSIRLPKSSASLIFTKKELLPQRSAAVAPVHASNANNNCATQQQQQQQQRNQPKQHNSHQKSQQQQQLQHSLSLRSANEYVTRKPVKHLPASYQQQQQRRSLQLNYNNNLVTTTTCCSANNNHCCSATGKIGSGGGGNVGIFGGGVVLHKHHQTESSFKTTVPKTANATVITTTTTTVVQQQQHQSFTGNTNTAAATRKQLAYSWYAPVYSALEEELEQDSRDSSPIHNLANRKKQHVNPYQHRSTHNSTAADNETVALLETRNQINIQAQLHAQANSHRHASKEVSSGSGADVNVGSANGIDGSGLGRIQQRYNGQVARRANGVSQAPTTLPLTNSHNATLQSEIAGDGGISSGAGGIASNSDRVGGATTAPVSGYDSEGALANSLSGTLPPRRRIENFLKSLVGRKSSNARASGNPAGSGNAESNAAMTAAYAPKTVAQQPILQSPEITVTRTPSEHNLVLLCDTSLRTRRQKLQLGVSQAQRKGDCGDKVNENGAIQGSTSSLNVVQQKLWNMMRREGSAASLYNEKSQSIVQYRGLRKCETVLALTRQTNTLSSPAFGGSASAHVGGGARYVGAGRIGGVGEYNSTGYGNDIDVSVGMRRKHITGSGIFSASGVEQIRPLNRLRHSVTSVNATVTCSRCSSLLSLAASGSRYSINTTPQSVAGAFVHVPPKAMPTSVSQHQLHALTATLDCKPPPHSSQQHQQQRKISNVSSSQLSSNSNVISNSRSVDAAVLEQSTLDGSSSGNCSRKSSSGAPSTSSITPPSNMTTATLTSSMGSPHVSTPTTPTATATAAAEVASQTNSSVTPTATAPQSQIATTYMSTSNNTSGTNINLPSSMSTPCTSASSSSATTPAPTYALPTTSEPYPFTITSLLTMSTQAMHEEEPHGGREQVDNDVVSVGMPVLDSRYCASCATVADPVAQPTTRFQLFTCKLCLVDVEAEIEATTLQQCGCQFCTEIWPKMAYSPVFRMGAVALQTPQMIWILMNLSI